MPPDWKCCVCGEQCPATFAVCWKCGATAPVEVVAAAQAIAMQAPVSHERQEWECLPSPNRTLPPSLPRLPTARGPIQFSLSMLFFATTLAAFLAALARGVLEPGNAPLLTMLAVSGFVAICAWPIYGILYVIQNFGRIEDTFLAKTLNRSGAVLSSAFVMLFVIGLVLTVWQSLTGLRF